MNINAENHKDLIIIMPLFNESETVEKTLELWQQTLELQKIDYRLEIHNDGSTDNSQQIVERIIERNSNIQLFNHPHKGFSKTLYNAYKNVDNADFVFQTDSDDEINPQDFVQFWQERLNADLLIGNRMHRKQTLQRKLVTSFASFFISKLFNRKITDVNVPFRLFKLSLLKDFLNVFPIDYKYPNLHICAYCLYRNLSIIQIPIEYNNRKKRKSHLNNIAKLLVHSALSFLQLILFKQKLKKNIN